MSELIRAQGWEIRVLYLDNHLLAVEKPPNLPVQRDSSGDADLLTLCKGFIGERFHKPGAVYLGLVHRLDRPVGGAMVLARTSKAAARLSQQFSAHTADKRYLAVVQGFIKAPVTLEDWLFKDERSGMVRVVQPDFPGAKRALLASEPLASRDGLTLMRVTLHTGRAHQIRVQHAHAGFPLWGDARYGGGLPGQQIALWAHRLQIEHPTLHTPLTFESSPPLTGAWAHFFDLLPEVHS